jgi:hypothetical protein
MAQCNTQMEIWMSFTEFQFAMGCYYLMHLFGISIVWIPSFEGFDAVSIVCEGYLLGRCFFGKHQSV